MIRRAIPLALTLASAIPAMPSVPGHATAEWIAASDTCLPGQPVATAVRMRIENGWHTYWTNPGDAGMPTGFEWQLPDGWKAGEPGFPVPKQFSSEGLGSYGYEGTVVFPVDFTPPPDFKGSATLRGTVTWLACNDGGCVPGEAEVTLTLTAGPPAASRHRRVIEQARRLVPGAPPDGMELEFREKDGAWEFTILPGGPDDPGLDGALAWPATASVADATAEIRFEGDSENGWIARTAKSEFAPADVEEITLVVQPKREAPPFSLQGRRGK